MFLEGADSARNYAVEVNQEDNRKFYECSNQRSMLQVEDFSKWRIPDQSENPEGMFIPIAQEHWDYWKKNSPNMALNLYIPTENILTRH